VLKSLLLFVGFIALAYVALVRDRAWHVGHYERMLRREYFGVCAGLALVLATVATYLLRDAIVCPSGTAYHDLVSIKTQTGKGGLGIECRDDAGESAAGSVFAGVVAWLFVLVGVFAGSAAIWRRFGPPAPPPSPAPTEAPRFEPPTDKRERRRPRNREKQRRRAG
jgi:hypothetical protein